MSLVSGQYFWEVEGKILLSLKDMLALFALGISLEFIMNLFVCLFSEPPLAALSCFFHESLLEQAALIKVIVVLNYSLVRNATNSHKHLLIFYHTFYGQTNAILPFISTVVLFSLRF